jgi:hypothetical protein
LKFTIGIIHVTEMKIKTSTSDMRLVEQIPKDVWYNHIFYHTLPTEISQLQLVSRYFKTLLQQGDNSAEFNDMWKFHYNQYVNDLVAEELTKLRVLTEILEQPKLKMLYSFCDTSNLRYSKVFRDVVETMKYNHGRLNFQGVYLNMKLMKRILNTEWTYSGLEVPSHIKCVFVGDKGSRITEFLVTAITNSFPDEVPSVFDNVSNYIICYSYYL